MLIFVGSEALKMMLDEKLVNELPSVRLIHRHIPDGSDNQTRKRSPKQAENECFVRQSPGQKIIKGNDGERKDDSDQTFGKQRDGDKEVKSEKWKVKSETEFFFWLVEDEKRDERCCNRESQNYIKARAARKRD